MKEGPMNEAKREEQRVSFMPFTLSDYLNQPSQLPIVSRQKILSKEPGFRNDKHGLNCVH